MALGDKLKKISANFEKGKQDHEKKILDETLKPIRERIKELEKTIKKLDIIKGSLELTSNPKKEELGMKGYALKTNEELAKGATELELNLDQNREALEGLGITTVQQLVDSPEFAEEAEILNHKKNVEKREGLKLSDKALQKRLETLEVSFDKENFSYELAEQAVEEKLKSLEDELLQEKIKTPEGKEEIIDFLAASLTSYVVPVVLESPQYGKEGLLPQEIEIGSKGPARLVAEGVKMHLSDPHLVPKEVEEIEKKFGKEVAQEALEEAYRRHVEAVFNKLDSEFTFTNVLLGDLKNRTSPEQWRQAKDAFEDFNQKTGEVLSSLAQKSENLKAKGIDFNSRGPSGYGGAWKDYLKPFEYDSITDEVKKSLDSFMFPPSLDYEKITSQMLAQKKLVEDFEEKLSLVDTEDDVKKFYGRSEKTIIGNFQKDLYNLGYGRTQISESYHQGTDLRFVFSVGFTHEQELTSRGIASRRTVAIDTIKEKSYEDAVKYLNAKKMEQDEFQNRVMESIMSAIALQNLEKELGSENKKLSFSPKEDIASIQQTFAIIERNKDKAKNYLEEIAKFEAKNGGKLDQIFFLKGHTIENRSLKNEYEAADREAGSFEAKLQEYTREYDAHLKSEPILFKGSWKEKKEKLEIEIAGTRERVEFWKKKRRDSQGYRSNIPDTPQGVEDVLMGVMEEMSLAEAVPIMKKNLEEMINKKLPASIDQLYKEYQSLDKQLTFSKKRE